MRFDQSRAGSANTFEAGAAELGDPAREAAFAPRAARISLRAYLLALVFLALAPAVLLGAVTTRQLGKAYSRSAEAGLASTAKALATALGREVEMATVALTTLTASPPLEAGDIGAVYPQAAAVGRAFGGWVALLEPDLRQVFNTLRPLGAEFPIGAGGPFVARALATGQTVVSDVFLGATARRQVIAVFQPLPFGAAGAAPGERRILLLAFGAERLSALLERQELGRPGSFAVLTDGAGRVAARSVNHARFLGQSAPAWYLDGTHRRESGSLRGASLDGPDMVLAFSRLERVPSWTVAVALPLAAHEAEWHGPMLRFGLGAAAVAGVAALLAALLARRLHQPLRALVQDAQRLQRDFEPPQVAPAPSTARIAEIEVLRSALWRSGVALRERATAEGRAAAAEDAAGELREAAQRRELLMAELNHRVKNTLATVQSLAAQTLRGTAGDPARFARHFLARLSTLARAHNLLSEGGWRPTEFGIVARASLAPWLAGAAGGERIHLDAGDRFVVSPHQTQALVMALHELATNATKYGALSQLSSGRIELVHKVGADGMATIYWTETGGPPVPGPPAQRGFGTRLLERGLARDLGPGSSVELRFEPRGLHAVIRFNPVGV